jgi:hypothetical protein
MGNSVGIEENEEDAQGTCSGWLCRMRAKIGSKQNPWIRAIGTQFLAKHLVYTALSGISLHTKSLQNFPMLLILAEFIPPLS